MNDVPDLHPTYTVAATQFPLIRETASVQTPYLFHLGERQLVNGMAFPVQLVVTPP